MKVLRGKLKGGGKKNYGCVRTEETIKVPRDYADQGWERKEKEKKEEASIRGVIRLISE